MNEVLYKSINDVNYCNEFIDPNINNTNKAKSTCSRFLEVLSDPNNNLLVRHNKAGQEENDYIYTFPGIKVNKDSYYGNHINILKLNKGSHEPSEERMFQNILTDIPENGIMLELGSYWSFYSIWFNKTVKNAKNYCIEPGDAEMKIGIYNCKLNNAICDYTKGFVGSNIGVPREASNATIINLNDYLQVKNINKLDILHSDIQGAEFEMLTSITNLLDEQKIRYLFISTHSNEIHYKCIELFKKHNYRIIANSNFDDETYCFDGIIVACHKDNNKFKEINLGNRKHTKLLTRDSEIGKQIQSFSWTEDSHWL